MKEKLFRNGKVKVQVFDEGTSICSYSVRPTNDDRPNGFYIIIHKGFSSEDILFSLFGLLAAEHSPFLSTKERVAIAIDKAEAAYDARALDMEAKQDTEDLELLEQVS